MSDPSPATLQAPVTVRCARPADAAAMQAFLRGLSITARRLRFHGAVTEASPSLLRCLVESDGERHVALVACVPGPGGADEIVGQACCAVESHAAAAEFALVV